MKLAWDLLAKMGLKWRFKRDVLMCSYYWLLVHNCQVLWKESLSQYFPTNFPTFQLWKKFEVIDKKTMFLLLKQVQPTLNEVPRASTGCHASPLLRNHTIQAEFEARFRRLDGDSSGKVRSLGMKIGFFQKRKRNMICTQNQQKADVNF